MNMDRRYRMELQLVRVPVVWKAKVQEKKLFPVTRKVPEERAIRRRNLAAVKMFMARLMDGVPQYFRPEGFMPIPEVKPRPNVGNPITFIRFTTKGPLRPPWEDE